MGLPKLVYWNNRPYIEEDIDDTGTVWWTEVSQEEADRLADFAQGCKSAQEAGLKIPRGGSPSPYTRSAEPKANEKSRTSIRGSAALAALTPTVPADVGAAAPFTPAAIPKKAPPTLSSASTGASSASSSHGELLAKQEDILINQKDILANQQEIMATLQNLSNHLGCGLHPKTKKQRH